MRRTILTTLVLTPALAFAQAGLAAATTSPSSALHAELSQSAGLVAAANTEAAAKVTLNAANIAVHEAIQATSIGNDFMEAALGQGGSLEYSLRGAAPIASTAPMITRAVELDLTPNDLAAQPSTCKVVVRATVDQYGIPRNITVTQSAGSAAIDQKAIAAVRQYRFKPATIDNQATTSTVAIAIKIQK